MTITPLAGTSQIATALTTLGTTALGSTRNELLTQLIVAAANATGGGLGGADLVRLAGDARYALRSQAPLYLPDITALTGGTSTCLDSIPTVGLALRTLVQLVIDDVQQTWLLKSGTTATDAANGRVRGIDYATTTNEKYWFQIA